jgi:hypothetical protein
MAHGEPIDYYNDLFSADRDRFLYLTLGAYNRPERDVFRELGFFTSWSSAC